MNRLARTARLVLGSFLALGVCVLLGTPYVVEVRTTVSPPLIVNVQPPAARPPSSDPDPTAISSSCIQPGVDSQPYANDPGKTGPKAFGPIVDAATDLAQVKTELRLRLCGRPGHGPDERLWAALLSVVNNSDPNVQLPAATWKQGIEDFVGSQLQWEKGALATEDYSLRAVTLDMAPGQFPLVGATSPSSRHDQFLVVPVAWNAQTVVLHLRLVCGFQPYLASLNSAPASFRPPA